MTAEHVTHETVTVPIAGRDWRISSYTIDGTPHVSAHHTIGGMSIALYFEADEARAWRDAIDRALAALPVTEPAAGPSAGERRAMGVYEAGELG